MKLATAGDNCMDVYRKLNRAFPGGNPVNVAVYFVRMGGNASYTGAVGDDEYGDIIRGALSAKGVDVSHLHTLPGHTAVTQVELVEGERVFGDYEEGVLLDFSISPADIDFLCSQDMVHTGLWGNMEAALPAIKRRGTPVSFDFATAENGIVLEKALPYVDYAFFARERDNDELRVFMRDMLSRGPKLVVATLGGEGSLAYDGSRFVRSGIVPVDAVDSMGAGDSYIAGFLKGILENRSLEECMRMGAANASETLRYMGAW